MTTLIRPVVVQARRDTPAALLLIRHCRASYSVGKAFYGRRKISPVDR